MPNDTEEIIQEFLEIWQKQFSYIAKDPETVANMLEMYQKAQENYFEALKRDNNATKPGTDTNLHGDANDELCQLRQRIAGLEKRVAELESRAGKPRQKTSGANTRKKPGRTGTRTTKTAK